MMRQSALLRYVAILNRCTTTDGVADACHEALQDVAPSVQRAAFYALAGTESEAALRMRGRHSHGAGTVIDAEWTRTLEAKGAAVIVSEAHGEEQLATCLLPLLARDSSERELIGALVLSQAGGVAAREAGGALRSVLALTAVDSPQTVATDSNTDSNAGTDADTPTGSRGGPPPMTLPLALLTDAPSGALAAEPVATPAGGKAATAGGGKVKVATLSSGWSQQLRREASVDLASEFGFGTVELQMLQQMAVLTSSALHRVLESEKSNYIATQQMLNSLLPAHGTRQRTPPPRTRTCAEKNRARCTHTG